ncbi:MAG: zf-HC2 domain-containing protein [Anaerolineaceae bacterium]|nr:zf-HC2 domain-containing protein [Anaerolineaceae bacterium]
MSKHNNTDCQDILENLCDYIDNELDKSECEKLEEHISNCEDCQIVVKTIRETIRLCKDGSKDIVLPQDTYNRLLTHLGLEKE